MKQKPERYWRRKLSAYMHDNPDKPLAVGEHEAKAFMLAWADQFQSLERFDKRADFHASAADRLPFPNHHHMRAKFDGVDSAFKHPMSAMAEADGSEAKGLDLACERPLRPEEAYEAVGDTRVILGNNEADDITHFLARWRLWRHWACERESRLAFLPADTRIPDHTIWNHLSVATAFQGCLDIDPKDGAAILLLSLGPVQPFIAAARSIRDLWSGSYLLSYIVASAIGEVARSLGPDHILFPSAWGQPLVDLMLQDLYEKASIDEDNLGSIKDLRMGSNARARQRFLLPSLPNRFLALVPACDARDWGHRLEQTIQRTLNDIGQSVLKHVELKGKDALARLPDSQTRWLPNRFDPQLQNSLEISWQALPFPKSVEEAKSIANKWLPRENGKAHPSCQILETMDKAFSSLAKGHKTGYGMVTKTTAWPAAYALVSWMHDAVKQTRAFDGWQNPENSSPGQTHNKDTLTGKEEYILSLPDGEGAEEIAQNLSRALANHNPNCFKPGERLGALTLVKRLWHLTWLAGSSGHGFQPEDFRMPNTHLLAQGEPFGDDSAESETDTAPDDDRGKGSYYAVLALDGDEMGKWVSGRNTPRVRSQLAAEALEYYERDRDKVSWQDQPVERSDEAKKAFQAFLDMKRPLSPSFHLQFSEALANFGLYAVRRIVEAFDGRLVYAGGDDVLALLPADKALECAGALRAAFRGDAKELNKLSGAWKVRGNGAVKDRSVSLFELSPKRPGAIRLHTELRNKGFALSTEPEGYDLIVPGPAADVSVGLAVTHEKAPLQDAVREAQRAEKRAKSKHGRSAFALSLLKRSGETIHWGAKWKSGALPLYRSLAKDIQEGRLSNRFPHRAVELLHPYLLEKGQSLHDPFDTVAIILSECRFALERQCQSKGEYKSQLIERNLELLEAYLESFDRYTIPKKSEDGFGNDPAACKHQALLRGVIGLCQSLAFIERKRDDHKKSSQNETPARDKTAAAGGSQH